MNQKEFDQGKAKFAQRLWTLRVLSQRGQGLQLELGELYKLIETNLPLAADSYSQVFVNEQLHDQRLREEMVQRRHVLYDIPRGGLFQGHTRKNTERYMVVEHLILSSGFPNRIVQPAQGPNHQSIASWARRLVAATNLPWQDTLSMNGATTAALLPINAAVESSPPASVQPPVDLLLQELADLGCRHSANLFEFLSEFNRERLGGELLDYATVLRERQPARDANNETLQTRADLLIDQLLDSMSSAGYQLLRELIEVRLIEYRFALTHARQNGQTDDVTKYELLVNKYAKLQEAFFGPENLGGVQ